LGKWAEIFVWEAEKKFVLKKAGIIGLTLPETAFTLGHSQLFWLTHKFYFDQVKLFLLKPRHYTCFW